MLGRTQDGSPSPLKLSVQGSVNGGNSLADRQVYVPLDEGQWLADVEDAATEILVYGEGYLAADALAEDLRAMPGLQAFSVTSWKERDPIAAFTPR